MTKETEAALADWQNEDRDVCDDLYRHFDNTGLLDWIDIGKEATRVWNLMTLDDVEEESMMDGFFHAVAAAGNYGAMGMVAKMLGLDAEAFSMTVGEWEAQEYPDGRSYSLEEFMKKYRESLEYLNQPKAAQQ